MWPAGFARPGRLGLTSVASPGRPPCGPRRRLPAPARPRGAGGSGAPPVKTRRAASGPRFLPPPVPSPPRPPSRRAEGQRSPPSRPSLRNQPCEPAHVPQDTQCCDRRHRVSPGRGAWHALAHGPAHRHPAGGSGPASQGPGGARWWGPPHPTPPQGSWSGPQSPGEGESGAGVKEVSGVTMS